MHTKEKPPAGTKGLIRRTDNIIQLHPTLRQCIAHLPWWNKCTAIGLLMETGTIPLDAPGKLFNYRLPRQNVLNGIKTIHQSDEGAI